MNPNKILIVGINDYYIYQKALCNAFNKIGYIDTEVFSLRDYFKGNNKFTKLYDRAQIHYILGSSIIRMNYDLKKYVKEKKFDLVFLYNCTMIYPSTVRYMQRCGARVFSYQNDDFFSDYYPFYYWRYAKRNTRIVDLNYVFRLKNFKDIEKYADRYDSKILRAYYIEDDNYICKEDEIIEDTPDVLCLAHYENDERIEYITELAKEGIRIGVPEGLFIHIPEEYRKNVVCLNNTRAPYYNRLLNSCKIPIIFLSSLNNDTYTTRCFEIPAAGKMIFCSFNDDMNSMYEEGREAVYYRNQKDFVKKIKYYLEHDDERERIAHAGYNRLLKDGHEIKDRARQIISDYNELDNK